MSKRLREMVVSRDYFSNMKKHRVTMIKKYKDLTDKYKDYYEDWNRKYNIHKGMSLLEYRQKCNNNPVCVDWDIVVSDFVAYMWGENVNVDKSIYKNRLGETINIIISEIEELWEISAYLNFKIGLTTGSFSDRKTINVVNITTYSKRTVTPKRGTPPNVLLKNGDEPAPTYEEITNWTPFSLTNKTVEPITTKNSITTIFKNLVTTENPVKTILKNLPLIVVSGALTAWMMYYKTRQQDEMAGGVKEDDDEIKDAFDKLIEADVNIKEVENFINTSDNRKQLIDSIKKTVPIEDFKEFDLEDGETVFRDMFDGGKRKRSTKRSTKKNKKSNRKRRA